MANANYAKSGASTLHAGGAWTTVYFDAMSSDPYSTSSNYEQIVEFVYRIVVLL